MVSPHCVGRTSGRSHARTLQRISYPIVGPGCTRLPSLGFNRLIRSLLIGLCDMRWPRQAEVGPDGDAVNYGASVPALGLVTFPRDAGVSADTGVIWIFVASSGGSNANRSSARRASGFHRLNVAA